MNKKLKTHLISIIILILKITALITIILIAYFIIWGFIDLYQ